MLTAMEDATELPAGNRALAPTIANLTSDSATN